MSSPVDRRVSTAKHGIRAALVRRPSVSHPFLTCPRYDLNALFTRGFGNLTINVQGLAKVSSIAPFPPCLIVLQGMFLPLAFYWGQDGARDNYSLQIRNIVEAGYRALPEKPVCLGECGIPFDMNEREAFRSGDFTWQERMMDALCTGLERSLVAFK